MDSVINAEALDKGTTDLFYKLLGMVNDIDDILCKLRESVWFQTMKNRKVY